MSATSRSSFSLLRRAAHGLRAVGGVLASMRFAIGLLVVIGLVSTIGTVVPQHQPYARYVEQFGARAADVLEALGFTHLYQTGWFLAMLGFLVASTALCLARNAPKIVRDWRTLKENIRVQNLQAFGQKASAALGGETATEAAQRIGHLLAQRGWRVALQERALHMGTGWMVAAKKGGINRLGYIAGHGAIVLICLGGLLDGGWLLQMQMALGGKHAYKGSGALADVPAQHRMGAGNLGFRGSLFVPEGSRSDAAVLTTPQGLLVQDLPFAVELQKFIVDYYPSGMPRQFASEVVIHDKATGQSTPARIEVNRPFSYRGVEIFQSGFDDGGSAVTLQAVPMHAAAEPFEVQATVGETSTLGNASEQRTLEITSLRVMNVENMGEPAAPGAAAASAPTWAHNLRRQLQGHLGAAHNANAQKSLRNVGPSIGYKLRDAAGQASEFNNYMLPLFTSADLAPEFLFGARTSSTEPMRYLRIPADERSSLDDFRRLRQALMSPSQRREAAQRYVAQSAVQDNPALAAQLAQSAEHLLAAFAGDPAQWPAARRDPQGPAARSFGLQALAALIEKNAPADQQSRLTDALQRVFEGSLLHLLQTARARDGLPPLDMAVPRNQAFMAQSVLALNDAPFYPEPLLLQLTAFKQVQASVFQVARAPGKWVVYTGCLLLIVGVFAMLYIRERRVWVWLAADAQGAVLATLAYSSNRRNSDSDAEFAVLKEQLLGEVG